VTTATPGHWRNTILAGLANYIDAGSIVAGSAALALWKQQYGLSDTFLGLIAAFSANAISPASAHCWAAFSVDRYGRKKIYQYDMLFYAFGMAWLVFASAPWMIVWASCWSGSRSAQTFRRPGR
jgi:inositol transporter-like SP family MFS transporter